LDRPTGKVAIYDVAVRCAGRVSNTMQVLDDREPQVRPGVAEKRDLAIQLVPLGRSLGELEREVVVYAIGDGRPAFADRYR
jgi:hypothetical protein